MNGFANAQLSDLNKSVDKFASASDKASGRMLKIMIIQSIVMVLQVVVAFPLALFIFAGSYFGIWKKNLVKLPRIEAVSLFFILWVITGLLLLIFRVLLASQDQLTRSTIGNLWGPLIVGIIIGRALTSWRRKIHAHNQEKK